MYERGRKTDASPFVVIMIVIVGEGQGGGVTYPERTEERQGKHDKIVADE